MDNPHASSQGRPDNETAVLDTESALKRLAGQRHIYVRALKKVVPDYSEVYEILVGQLASGNRDGANITAHSVSGTAATIGAVRLSRVAAKLEQAIKDGAADIDGLLHVFGFEVEQAIAAVKVFLEAQEL